MIIASVRFRLPPDTSLSDAKRLYEQNVDAYRRAPGLISKHYVFGNGRGGGIYLWDSRDAAERFYTPEWRRMIEEKYDGGAEIEWLEVPLVVDNRGQPDSIAAE